MAWGRGFDKLDQAGAESCSAATHIMLLAAELDLFPSWIGNFNPVR